MSRYVTRLIASLSISGIATSFVFPTVGSEASLASHAVRTSVCIADLNRGLATISKPDATRLTTSFVLGGAIFTSVASGFVPVVTSQKAWRDFREQKQSTATYKIVLARMRQDNPPGTNPAFKAQDVWLILAQHVAYMPSPAPGTNYSRSSCAFGWSYDAVNATSGKAIYGSGG